MGCPTSCTTGKLAVCNNDFLFIFMCVCLLGWCQNCGVWRKLVDVTSDWIRGREPIFSFTYCNHICLSHTKKLDVNQNFVFYLDVNGHYIMFLLVSFCQLCHLLQGLLICWIPLFMEQGMATFHSPGNNKVTSTGINYSLTFIASISGSMSKLDNYICPLYCLVISSRKLLWHPSFMCVPSSPFPVGRWTYLIGRCVIGEPEKSRHKKWGSNVHCPFANISLWCPRRKEAANMTNLSGIVYNVSFCVLLNIHMLLR